MSLVTCSGFIIIISLTFFIYMIIPQYFIKFNGPTWNICSFRILMQYTPAQYEIYALPIWNICPPNMKYMPWPKWNIRPDPNEIYALSQMKYTPWPKWNIRPDPNEIYALTQMKYTPWPKWSSLFLSYIPSEILFFKNKNNLT